MAVTLALDNKKMGLRRRASKADLALAAIEGVEWPVALIDRRDVVLLHNQAFAETFSLRPLRKRLDGMIAAFRARGERRFTGHLTLGGGRTFRLDLVNLSQGIFVTGRDVTETLARDAQAGRAARIDGLTGLANRLGLEARLEELAGGEAQEPAALLAINLRRFKRVNVTLGRVAGNALLKLVGERILSAIGPKDLAARIGGDEFAVLLVHGSMPQAADALAQRLVDLLTRSYVIEGHLLTVGVSIGIALTPHSGSDAESLLKNAGLAVAETMGKPTVGYRFFKDEMNRQVEARQKLENDLRRALALREFELVYQPQCNLDTGRITGFEALLRWHNAARGPVSPGDFIPIVEDIGLIVPIGEWVLRTACRQAAAWKTPFRIAVNVSAIQIASRDFPAAVTSALSDSGLAPDRLELEITESALLGDNAAALATLTRLHKLGVRISMDDFGTGYSSLSYLHSFPFDAIKIDQSFVRGQSGDSSGMAIVRAAAALAKSLGMTTVAEGVETMEQLDLVAEAGCTDAQGYLISRPLPPQGIDSFLRAGALCFSGTKPVETASAHGHAHG